jgi:hypothetical protein
MKIWAPKIESEPGPRWAIGLSDQPVLVQLTKLKNSIKLRSKKMK